MPNLFEMFKFSKLLNVQDGSMDLMGVDINIIPTQILCELQKGLISSLGFEKTYDLIYKQAKEGSLQYNAAFIKKQKFADKHKEIDWQVKIVTFSGWGKLEVMKIDFKEQNHIVKSSNSPYPKDYGKANYAVDIIPTGFVAGGLSAVAGTDLDALETKCMARGDPYCEIEVGTPEYILQKKKDLWKKWKLI